MSDFWKKFCTWSAVGAIVIAIFATVALLLPTPIWRHADWYHQGIRLLRDEGELNWYFEVRSRWVAEHRLPYSVGNEQEYPPLAVIFFSWPRLLADDFRVYEIIFVAQMAALFALLWGLTALLLADSEKSRLRLLFFALPGFLYFSLWRFDLLAAVLLVAALWALRNNRRTVAVLLLIAGVLTKVYPIFFLLPTLLWLGAAKSSPLRPKLRKQGRLTVTAVIGLGALGLMIAVGFWPMLPIVLMQVSRPFDYGTLGAPLALFKGALNPFWSDILSRSLAGLFTLLQILPVAYLIGRARITRWQSVVRGGLFLLIPVLFFNRFFSESFLLWLVPPALLVAEGAELPLLAALDLVIFIQFPVLFGISPHSGIFAIYGLVKYGLLAALWLINLKRLRADNAFMTDRRHAQN